MCEKIYYGKRKSKIISYATLCDIERMRVIVRMRLSAVYNTEISVLPHLFEFLSFFVSAIVYNDYHLDIPFKFDNLLFVNKTVYKK